MTRFYSLPKDTEAFAKSIFGDDFIGDDDVCLVLVENIFYGLGLSKLQSQSVANVQDQNMATVFGY